MLSPFLVLSLSFFGARQKYSNRREKEKIGDSFREGKEKEELV